MQRGGPRGTIPPPSERHPAGPRWPLQVIAGVCVVVAVFFGMRLLRHHPTPATPPSEHPPETVAVTPPDDVQATQPVDAAAASALEPAFVSRLQLSGAHRLLGGIEVAPDVLGAVAELRLAEATRTLETQARGGDRNAIAALARLAYVCESGDPQIPGPGGAALNDASRRAQDVLKDNRQRVEAGIVLVQERQAAMKKACADTRFDSQAIHERLRRTAAAGDEISLWELGNESPSPAQRKHWTSAAMLGYLPAQLDLAESLMADNISGDRRELNRMSFWLTSAAAQSPRGKAMLAQCVVNNCGVLPPSGASAASLLQEAALSGEAAALGPLASIPSEDPAAPTNEELYGLNAFLRRLNELGCYGEFYPANAVDIEDRLQQLALRLSPSGVEEAHRLADEYWRVNGARARSQLHCD